jgi:hypothetical protein
MIRIYRNVAGQFAVQTTALDAETFIFELSEAMAKLADVAPDEDLSVAFLGTLESAFPIAFKLSGYKADGVTEQRTLLCGSLLPNDSECVAHVGR